MTETTIDDFENEISEELEETFEHEPDADPNAEEVARTSRPGWSKTNLLLAALVILQALLAIFMLWPRGGRVETGEPLLAGLTASSSASETESAAAVDALTNLVLTDDTGATLTLERSGDEWALAGTDGFPLKADSVSDVVEKLAALNRDRLVTRTSSSHERLQVAATDFVRKLDLTTADGTQTLYVGSSPASNATHVRLDGDDKTFLASGINSWELATTPSNWIETIYFAATATDVTEVTLENENGSFTFTRPVSADEGDGDGGSDDSAREWSLFGLALTEELDQAAITSLVSQSINLRMTKPLGKSAQPAYGLDTPQATLTLTLESAEGEKSTATLSIGAQAEDSTDYVIKSADSDYYVQVSSFSGEQLINKSRSDFVTEIELETSEEGQAGE